MKAKLVSQWGAQKGAEFWIGAEAAVGRGSDNEVRLDAKPVSNQHARIFFDPAAEAYFLEDLGSLNGTEIDGTPVTRVERLGRMHVLNFGGVCELLWVAVDLSPAEEEAPETGAEPSDGTQVDKQAPILPAALASGEAAASGATQVEEMAVALPEELAPEEKGEGGEGEDSPTEPEKESDAGPEFILAVIEDGSTWRFPLRPGENLVGRSKAAQVAVASPQLSRKHAVLTVDGGRVTVRDLGSRNQTFVDEQPVEGELEVAVRSRLRFGLLEAYLLRRDDDDLTLPQITVKDGE